MAPPVRVLLLSSTLLAAAGALWVSGVRDLAPPVAGLHLHWTVLTALFALAEVFVLQVQVRREAQSVSLSEIPLVLGLFFTSPRAYLLSWVVGPLLVFVLHRRQPALKITFNVALLLAQGSAALAVFALLAPEPLTIGPQAWLAAYVAGTLAGATATVMTTLVIALYGGGVTLRDLGTGAARGALASFCMSTLALVAVAAMTEQAASAWLISASAAVLLLVYRAYSLLNARYLSLERLYQFSQVVGRSPEVDAVLRSVLTQAKEVLRAEYAEITFLSTLGQREGVLVALGPTDRLERDVLTGDDAPWWELADADTSALLPRGGRGEPLRDHLVRRGLRDAVLAPMHGEAGVLGTIMVADRSGSGRSFGREDLRMLATVADHAGAALQNGRLIETLRHDAVHDALTGLPNRTLLSRRMTEATDALNRGATAGLAVMIMDLDGFKEVNDSLGHAHGDALLREVAARTSAVVAVPGPGRAAGTVARLGGDEFAMLVPDVDADGALAVARAVLDRLREPVPVDGTGIEIGASIGITLAPAHGTDTSELLKQADAAMYDAKRDGAGAYVYEPDRHAAPSPQRLALVGELRQAIAGGQLVIHVQPKTTLRTGEVPGVEALARWEHPRLGLLLPEEFIGVAERCGLIRPLTMAVLDAALAASAAWHELGHEVTVAVNLSARSLSDHDLPGQVARLLQEHGVPAGSLTLEITETSIMTDPARSIGLLTRLADLGVRLSVDDFGTGYSSLAYLKRLPVQEVKIDRSFVTNMAHDADDATIVRSIIDLGANLSLEAVAEGVEDEQTREQLREMGCATAQGYHLGRPMPVADFPAWLDGYQARQPQRVPAP